MSSSNCCFLTCIQISQEAGQVVWYSHLFQNIPQFIVVQRNNTATERGRDQVPSTQGLGYCSVYHCLLVSGETPHLLCPSGKARPYLLQAHPPSFPSCAKSSSQGSWLGWSSVQLGSGVPRTGQFPVTVPRLWAITISHTAVCGYLWPGLPNVWFSSSLSGFFFLESVA